MKSQRLPQTIVLLSVVIFLFIKYSEACDANQTQYGCRIADGQCTCAHGCKSEFRYLSKKECQDALRGRASDICNQNPCKNGGICIQISYSPGFKCKCVNGFHGKNCSKRCPASPASNAAESANGEFPWECALSFI